MNDATNKNNIVDNRSLPLQPGKNLPMIVPAPSPVENTTFAKGISIPLTTHKILLPNCKSAGTVYSTSLKAIIEKFVDLEEIEKIDCPLPLVPSLPDPPPFDMIFKQETYELKCFPKEAGEFNLCFGVVTSREKHVFQCTLLVNPDPKTLWKNVPSEQNDDYAKPDFEIKFLACEDRLSIVAASQRGRSHAQDGKPRDDDFSFYWDNESDYTILAVADGAGSAKFSRKGAQIATLTVLETLKNKLNTEFWGTLVPIINKYITNNGDAKAEEHIRNRLYVLIEAAWEAKDKIRLEAESHEKKFFAMYHKQEKITARDYATTLILTIAKKVDAGWFIATYWVGDGGMGVYHKNLEKIIVQGEPDSGEYGGQTRFLTEGSPEVWPQGEGAAEKILAKRVHFDVVSNFDAIILMTDGITDPKFETDNNLKSPTKWNELWNDLEREVPFEKRDESVAAALLQWMNFWSPGNHDDRTMIVFY